MSVNDINAPHLLLIVGVGGMSAPEALKAARAVTPRVSVAYVAAWGSPEPARGLWESDPGDSGAKPSGPIAKVFRPFVHEGDWPFSNASKIPASFARSGCDQALKSSAGIRPT